jgi:hypothetical protein
VSVSDWFYCTIVKEITRCFPFTLDCSANSGCGGG